VKISIALCTYNGAQFLAEQLASIAQQIRRPDELIVCDDHSTDGTVAIIKNFAKSAGFEVRFYRNPQQLGSTQNFAKAIDLCNGDVIALCDQDDVWSSFKLARLEEVFSSQPKVGLVFTNALVVDQNLRPCGKHLWDWTFTSEEQRLVNKGKAFDVLTSRNVVTGATMAFRANFKQLCTPIPLDSALIHDGWIALVIAATAEVSALSDPLIGYRQHADQQLGVVSSGRTRKSGLGSVDETAAGRRRYYAAEVRKLNHLLQRLEMARDSNEFIRLDDKIHLVRELSAHYQVRGSMPTAWWQRGPFILNEVLTLRYHRYSKGLRSAVLDFVRTW
jgi:glycosyltransferase involved in cell wall biosynthesis